MIRDRCWGYLVAMPRQDEEMVQLATRIPKELHRRMRLHCVIHEMSVMDFVITAIREKLGRAKKQATG